MAYFLGFGLWELYFFFWIGIPLNILCIIFSFLKKNIGWQNMTVRVCTIINIVTIIILLLWIVLNGAVSDDMFSFISILVIGGVTAFFLYRLRKKRLAEAAL
ncbi:MAG: hypothetical protein K0Q79_802 [Flavipsychrobacter sp.]|jgi:hypothetical protein|nr:hypothetical protein [Flavipsychrobacter sp.]